jgi:uncharacterized repeat protein (TIGR01451 family)
MLKVRFLCLGLVALLATSAPRAFANHMADASVSATCSSYTINLEADSLASAPGTNYAVNWTITLTPTSGAPITIMNSVNASVVAPNATFIYSATNPLGSLTGNYTLSGSATLVNTTTSTDLNTIPFNTTYVDATNTYITTSPATVTCGSPQLEVVKTADLATVTPGEAAGFTVTISNPGSAAAAGVTLSDPLPAGSGHDIDWMIDTTTGNPASFTITGSVGSQVLALNPSCITLGAGASLSVHITGMTYADDTTTSSSPALNIGGVSGYTVLYEGTGGHNLQITNVSIGGNVGVGGTGHVQFNGPGTIGGRLDFSAPNTGQYSNNNGSNVGPTSVNYNVSAVTTALDAIATLNTSLGGLSGTNIAFNNANQTVNESSGVLQTTGGVTYRVFNVTSYSENNGDVVTINGDGSGDTVVFNFGFNSNVNLGGDVVLTGGLTPDQVIWNFTSSNQNIQLNNNASSYPYPSFAYRGVILAPDDKLSVVNTSLIGRVFGGDSGDMQIVSGDNIHTPPTTGTLANTATVSATGVSSVEATATVTIN